MPAQALRSCVGSTGVSAHAIPRLPLRRVHMRSHKARVQTPRSESGLDPTGRWGPAKLRRDAHLKSSARSGHPASAAAREHMPSSLSLSASPLSSCSKIGDRISDLRPGAPPAGNARALETAHAVPPQATPYICCDDTRTLSSSLDHARTVFARATGCGIVERRERRGAGQKRASVAELRGAQFESARFQASRL